MARRTNPHIGSTLESFLKEEGILKSATRKAAKAVTAWRIARDRKSRSREGAQTRIETRRVG
jgi:hypothetical protein